MHGSAGTLRQHLQLTSGTSRLYGIYFEVLDLANNNYKDLTERENNIYSEFYY